MTKLKAQQLGSLAQKKMKTGGWKVRIWENMGYHSSLEKGGMTIHIHENYSNQTITYTTLLSADERYYGAGETFWSTGSRHSKDPNRAVAIQLAKAKKFVNHCTKTIAKVTRG